MSEEVPQLFKDYKEACLDSVLSSKKLFQQQYGGPAPEFYESLKLKLNVKANNEYKLVQKEIAKNEGTKTEEIATQMHNQIQQLSANQIQIQQSHQHKKLQQQEQQQLSQDIPEAKSQYEKILEELPKEQVDKLSKLPKQFLQFQKATADNPITDVTYLPNENVQVRTNNKELVAFTNDQKNLQVIDPARLGRVLANKVKKVIRPDWHRPWKLMRVISGHHGWVRSIAVDPANQFFVTGSSDRTIKFWDLATGNLKITYTGHISQVRGLVVSHRHPYLFSAGEDKTVKCWDLEQNKIIRDYHGHLSGVYCITQHPTLDFIATGGRDSVVRLWDIRTRTQIHVFEGHTGTVDALVSQEFEPQIISGSQDTMIRTWDIVSGRCVSTLTNHKKSVRALAVHPNEYTFASAAPDNIKVWKCPEGIFLRNMSGHNAIVNTIALNKDNVAISGADNGKTSSHTIIIGSLCFWDWKSGYNFQKIQTVPQPGSISAENGIFCSTFDQSQMRYITGECDKSIKMYKEDENATPETHPIEDFKIEFQSTKY